MTTKLLPCPFCGGSAFKYLAHPVVECTGCDARMTGGDTEMAIAKWNIRTVASAGPVDVPSLQDLQKAMKDMVAELTAQVMRLSAEVEILKGRLQ